MESVFVASYLPPQRKAPFIQKAIGTNDLLKFFLQIAWEVKDIDTKAYAQLSEPVAAIGKMLGTWLTNTLAKSSQKTHAAQGAAKE